MRTLDDLEARRAVVAGPTPLPATATMSTPFNPYPRPATPMDIWNQAFQPMTISAHQQFGLQKTQQWNASNPSAMVGPAALNMMNMANLAPLRAPFGTPPPALMTTPGVTGMFQTPGDIASQQGLMASAAFLDPRTAAANLSSQRAEAWGQKYGGIGGAVAGTIGGAMLTGGGAMGLGATAGGMAGGWIGEQLGNLPLVKQIREFANRGVAENLSWMAQAQHGTFGRVSMGGGDIGLGGRGLSTDASMRLGQKLKGMSGQTGGMFNQMDMMNLTSAAGDAGLLDAASNIDQIANTVGSLMKVIGRLGKLTGDPDFRNNIRELGNMKRMGFTVDQSIDAIADVNRFARGAGMTRGQMGATMQAGAARAIGAGVTGGVGAMNAAIGAQQSRMLAGAFDPVQASLMGGTAGIGQTIEEGRTAFAAQTSRLFIPSLLTIGPGGEISLDQDKMRQLGGVGAINMQAIAAHGQQNLHAVAQQLAQQTGQPVASVLGDLMGRMPEFQSKLATQMTPGEYGRIQSNMILGMRETFGEYGAAKIVMGTEAGARIKLAELRDPKYHERQTAQLQESIKLAQGEANLVGGALQRQRQEARDRAEWDNYPVIGGVRTTLRGWGAGMAARRAEGGREDVAEAEEEAMEMQERADAARGIRTVRQRPSMGAANQRIVEEMRGHIRAGRGVTGFNRRGVGMEAFTWGRSGITFTGDTGLTQNEIKSAQRAWGTYGELGAWGKRKGMAWFGEDASSDAGGFAARVRDQNKRTLDMADTLGDVQRSSDQQFQEVTNQFYDELEAEDLEGGAGNVLASIQMELQGYAKKMGAAGRTVNQEGLRQAVGDALVRRGMSRGRATYLTQQRNVDFLNKWTARELLSSPDKDVQSAVQGVRSDAALLKGYEVESGKDMVENLRKGQLKEFAQLGIIGGKVGYGFRRFNVAVGDFKDLSDSQRRKIRGPAAFLEHETAGLTRLKGVEGDDPDRVRVLSAILARAGGGAGITEDEQQRAKAMLADIRRKGGADKDALERAVTTMAGAGDAERAFIGRTGRMYEQADLRGIDFTQPGAMSEMWKRASTAGSLESMVATAGRARAFEGGGRRLYATEFGKAFLEESEGGGTATTGVAPPGTAAGKEVTKLKGELKLAKDMRAAWVGPGSASAEIKEAAGMLKDAAVAQGARQLPTKEEPPG